MRTIPVLLAGLLAGVSLSGAPAHAEPDRGHGKPDIPIWVVRPCKSEDSANCRWDAQTRGNHRGHTFAMRQLHDGTFCVFYAERAYAAKHDYCTLSERARTR